MPRVRVARRRRSAVLLVALLPLGCSVYYGAESSMKTVASPLTSSASSVDSDSRETYRESVRDYTYAYVAAGGDAAHFARGLGDVARRQGISNWEERDATYVAIGAGLARARVGVRELDLFARDVAGTDSAKRARIRAGFDAVATADAADRSGPP